MQVLLQDKLLCNATDVIFLQTHFLWPMLKYNSLTKINLMLEIFTPENAWDIPKHTF